MKKWRTNLRKCLKTAAGTLLTLLLAGSTASAQTQHPSFSLTWTASTDAATNPSLTYNVYRVAQACPTSGQPSGMVKINSAPITGTSYVDTAVQVGQSYCYAATAVLNGGESADSNFSGGVSPLSPPTGFSAKPN